MLCININHPWSTKICFLSFLKIVHIYIYIYNIVYSTIQKQCSPNRTGDVPSSKLTELWEIDGNCPFIHDFPMTKCQLSPRNPRKEYRKYEKYYVLSLGLDFSIFDFFLIQHKQRWLFRTVVKNPSPIEGFPPRCPRWGSTHPPKRSLGGAHERLPGRSPTCCPWRPTHPETLRWEKWMEKIYGYNMDIIWI